MIRSAVARYDIKEVIAIMQQEHQDQIVPRDILLLWCTTHLSNFYGINIMQHVTLDAQTLKQVYDFAPQAQTALYRGVKPPVFDASVTPNFICDVMLRDDDMLVLNYSA